MRDWASGGAIKVERAKENINDLASRISAFRDLHPYFMVVKPEPDARGATATVARVDVRHDFHPILGAVAADAIHNLRSLLDILWRRATNEHPNRIDHRRKVYFPFASPDELESRYQAAKEPAIKGALKLACEIAPYEGGNDLLCFLSAADVRDKHEVPTLIASRMGMLGNPSASFQHNAFMLHWTRNFGESPPLKHGDILWSGPPSDPPTYYECEIAFEITFSKEGPFNGQPVLFQLTACAQAVERVVEAFAVAGLLG